MIRISLAYLLKLAAAIEPLRKTNPDSLWTDFYITLSIGRTELEGLLHGSVYLGGLRASFDSGNKLLTAVDELLESAQKNLKVRLG